MKDVITWKPRGGGVLIRREISGKEQHFPDISPETMHKAMQTWFTRGFDAAFEEDDAFYSRHVMFIQHGVQYDPDDYC